MTHRDKSEDQPFDAAVRRIEAKVLAADEDIRSEEVLDSDIKLLERAGSKYAGFARGVQGEQMWIREQRPNTMLLSDHRTPDGELFDETMRPDVQPRLDEAGGEDRSDHQCIRDVPVRKSYS